MIYATIDVALQGHPKAIKAGPAMYLWTYAMLWSRDQRESGFVPREVALRCAWAPQEDNERAAAALVASGLWLETEGGWEVWNYPQKNDTRGEIEARIAKTRERQFRYRKSVSASDAGETRDKRVSLGSGAHAGSDVVSDPEGVQGEPLPEVSVVRLRPVADTEPPPEVPRPVELGDLPTEDERGYAKQQPLQDHQTVWEKFVAHHAAAGSRFTTRERLAKWAKWIADELPRQRVARDRELQRSGGRRP